MYLLMSHFESYGLSALVLFCSPKKVMMFGFVRFFLFTSLNCGALLACIVLSSHPLSFIPQPFPMAFT